MKLPCQENPNAENDRALLAWKLCNRLRATLTRYHAQDLRNCLRRHDTCSAGTVQGYDFARVVSTAMGGCLSENEICHLADYFRSSDGAGVAYGQFLDVVAGEDEPFGKDLGGTLSVNEHRRLSPVLMEVAQALRFREQVLRPYFEDYDRIALNTGSVTVPYFKRVLYFLGITLRPAEFGLLAKRFMVGHYKIDYEAFIEEIDGLLRYLDGRGPIEREGDGEVVPAKVITVELPKVDRPEVGTVDLARVLQKDTAYHPCLAPSRQERDLRTLMLRIQRYVWENRVRIREFFEQYDTFQCGLISRSQFVRAMDAVGLSGLYRLPLTDGEIRTICDRYGDARDANRIRWDRFTNDVDEVFTVKNLDKRAFTEVESPPEEVGALEREGRKDRDLAKELVDCIGTLVSARRVLIEPVFKDFDPHRNGHISRSQVGEALSMAGVFITEEQRFALAERYCDDLGFNYVDFLKDVDPCPKIASAYEEMQARLAKINADAGPEPHPYERDIVRVLAKVKGQVVRRRLRIVDYMQGFDPLNHHRISCDQFRRGLATASIVLTPTEVCTLARMFKTPLQETVDYKRFCDTVAEVDYQCHLEKAPRLVPLRHFPSEDGPQNHLNFEERTIVSKALQRLARQADAVSNLSAPLKDFDRNNLGVVNRNQLIRAMATRDLHNALSSREFDVLCKCFAVEIGHRREVNYRALLAALDYLYANRENHPF